MPRTPHLLATLAMITGGLLATPALAQEAPEGQQRQVVRQAPARPMLRTAEGVLRHEPPRPGRKSVKAYHGHEWFLETANGERLALLPTASATAKTLRAHVGQRVAVDLQWYPGKRPHPMAQAPIDPMTRQTQSQGQGWHVQTFRALGASPALKRKTTTHAKGTKKMTTRRATGVLRHVPVDATRKSVAAYHGISWFLETTDGDRLSLIPTATVSAEALKRLVDTTVTVDLQWFPGKAPHPMEQAPMNPMTGAVQKRGAGWQVNTLTP